jgi:hypothetical protein
VEHKFDLNKNAPPVPHPDDASLKEK